MFSKKKRGKSVVSSLPLEHSRVHVFLGLRCVAHWGSFLHPTSIKCQAPLQTWSYSREQTDQIPVPVGRFYISQWISRPIIAHEVLLLSWLYEGPWLHPQGSSLLLHVLCPRRHACPEPLLSPTTGSFYPPCCFCYLGLSQSPCQGPLSHFRASETLLRGAVHPTVPGKPKRPGVALAEPHLFTFRLWMDETGRWMEKTLGQLLSSA